jgi:hypothetical protein
VVAISGDVRPEFYRMFDQLRVDFLKEYYPAELEKGYALSRQFAPLNQAVKDRLGLEGIDIRPVVNWFLLDPVNGLMRLMFDPLFDLIKGKIDPASFEETSRHEIREAFMDYFRDGYRRWVILGMVDLLAPDKNYLVDVADYSAEPALHEGDMGAGLRQDAVPEPKEAKRITFDFSLVSTIIVPKVLVHSTRLNRFVGMRPDFTTSHWSARNRPESAEWLSTKAIKQEFGQSKLWPDLLVYTGEHVDDLLLVADHGHLARPDIIVETREEAGWHENGGLELVLRHEAIAKPRYGSFVVCREPVPQAVLDALAPKPAPAAEVQTSQTPVQEAEQAVPPAVDIPGANVHIIVADYDVSRLEAVIAALQQGEDKAATATPTP